MITNSNPKDCVQARAAILQHLHDRWRSGDTQVYPLDKSHRYAWDKYGTQPNYFFGAGTMPCPICKAGQLAYNRAASNGHVWAKCSTQGCIRFME